MIRLLFLSLLLLFFNSCDLARIEDSDNGLVAEFSVPQTTLWVDCPVQFSNQSIGAASYVWDYGDGQTSTEENPEHTFTSIGTFSVKLSAINGIGQKDIIMEVEVKPQSQFVRTYPHGVRGYAVITTSDGGYLVSAGKWVNGDLVPLLIKMYETGDVDWVYQDAGFDDLNYGTALVEVSNGYVLTGYARNGGATESDILFIKVGFNGVLDVRKTIGAPGSWEEGADIVLLPGGGLVIAGDYKANSSASQQILVMELNSQGIQIGGNYTYGGAEGDSASSILKTAGGYLIAGNTWSSGNGKSDAYVIQLNDFFIVMNEETYGESESDFAYDITEGHNGGFVFVGSTFNINGKSDMYVVKIDDHLVKLEEKTFGDSDNKDLARSIIRGRDGGYIVGGYKERELIVDGKFWAFKINENLDQGWSIEIPGMTGADATEIAYSNDCGYIIVGEMDDEVLLVKTDVNGN